MLNNPRLKEILARLRSEYDQTVSAVRDKGAQRFGRTFALGLLICAIAYLGLYRPTQMNLRKSAREIDNARALASYGAQYASLSDQLSSIYDRLLKPADRERGLTNAVIELLRVEQITPDSLSPVTEQELDGLLLQSTTVKMTLRFEELFSLLTRLEKSNPILHLKSLSVSKESALLGRNSVTCEIVAEIPLKRYDR